MKYFILTLGCKVNTYESNVLVGLLDNHGYIYSKDEFDIAIVNTCCVTNQAAAKSRKELRALKRARPNAIIVAIGCYPQGFKEEVLAMSEVDIVIGNKDKLDLIYVLEEYLKTPKKHILVPEILKDYRYNQQHAKTFATTRAFIKIQDGCENFCSYCIIPYTRGPLTSKNASNIIAEINLLVAKGYKEVVLSGINIGCYKDAGINFSGLIEKILAETQVMRLRISSIEMVSIDNKLIELLNNPRLANHLHIPLQAGSNSTLLAMNRCYDTNEFASKIAEIRLVKPDISITTDMLVGYPTETEEDFAESLAFASSQQFAKIHVFPYSARKYTKAANLVDLKAKIKQQRAKELIELSCSLETKYAQKFNDQIFDVLIEEEKDGYFLGHTSNYLLVKTKHKSAKINQFCTLKLKIVDDSIFGL